MADTYYDATHTGLEIDEAVGKVLAPDTTPTEDSTELITSGGVYTALGGKQATLVSGTNIKTVGGQTLLASGDVPVALPIVAAADIAWNTAHNFGTLSANKSVTLPALPSGVTGEICLTATQGAGNSYKITLTAPTGVTITDGTNSGSSLEITPTAGKHMEISAAVVDTVISVLTNEV